MWKLERVITLPSAPSVYTFVGHLPVVNNLAWSHGACNSEISLYLYGWTMTLNMVTCMSDQIHVDENHQMIAVTP